MKSNFIKVLLVANGCLMLSLLCAQNVSLNMLVLNSGLIPEGGSGVLKATINATTGTGGQTNNVVAGKINLSVTAPPSLLISATQNDLPSGWIVRNNNGTVINICNSSSTIAVNTAVDLLINLEGVSATSGSPSLSGQLTFRTNCTAPGSLAGDNPSDNSSQAGYTVTMPTPLTLVNFSAAIINCQPALKWITENEINTDKFSVEKKTYQPGDAWMSIGEIKASGNSSVQQHYNFIDTRSTHEKQLYRLKMIDVDGKFKYSNVLPVITNCKAIQLQVYPNPVSNGRLNIIATGFNGNALATLLNVQGNAVLKKTLINGSNFFNTEGLASGSYFLNLLFEDGTSKKVMIFIQAK